METQTFAAAVPSAATATTTRPVGARATAAGRIRRAVVRHLPTAARLVLGLVFFVAGLNYFVPFLPQSEGPMSEGAMAVGMAFMKSGYLLPLIKGTEVAAAVLLLTNRFVPLALVLLAPLLVNIVAFHAFLAPEGTLVPVVLLACEIGLAWAYRDAFRPVLAARAVPAGR